MSVPLPTIDQLVAGGVGGPSVLVLVTPMRNALTIAARDQASSTLQIYKQVGASGAFRGGMNFFLPAIPGFLVLGPMYHVYHKICGSNAGAVALTALSESLCLYAAETKNAVVAYNGQAGVKPLTVPASLNLIGYRSATSPVHPGFMLHVSRNILAMSGMRVFTYPAQEVISKVSPKMSKEALHISGDLLANCVVSAISTPLHQLYGYTVTRPEGKAMTGAEVAEFFRTQYLKNGRVSSVAGRDIILRVAYNASIFTLYGQIERTCKKLLGSSE
eukprot:TRINITY_DN11848_c0_g1_i1.p1 TRINITY_DN11848_c0_g1~~TRINITY_DN11848_c0_g1_i1.p1  ORF type:complete len:274 (-),score=47.29 TRINITY_DN11848_c0_g1_i1:270-1091(-)